MSKYSVNGNITGLVYDPARKLWFRAGKVKKTVGAGMVSFTTTVAACQPSPECEATLLLRAAITDTSYAARRVEDRRLYDGIQPQADSPRLNRCAEQPPSGSAEMEWYDPQTGRIWLYGSGIVRVFSSSYNEVAWVRDAQLAEHLRAAIATAPKPAQYSVATVKASR